MDSCAPRPGREGAEAGAGAKGSADGVDGPSPQPAPRMCHRSVELGASQCHDGCISARPVTGWRNCFRSAPACAQLAYRCPCPARPPDPGIHTPAGVLFHAVVRYGVKVSAKSGLAPPARLLSPPPPSAFPPTAPPRLPHHANSDYTISRL